MHVQWVIMFSRGSDGSNWECTELCLVHALLDVESGVAVCIVVHAPDAVVLVFCDHLLDDLWLCATADCDELRPAELWGACARDVLADL